MNKTDNRHYNRKHSRDLNTEMNLWCYFSGKSYLTSNGVSNVIDIEHEKLGRGMGGWLTLTFENGETIRLRTIKGKPTELPKEY